MELRTSQAKPVQIVTGAWNVHVGDLVPVALDNSTLPGGKTITKGTLRGEVSDGMLCGLYELGLDERDFPYAAIKAAAILGNYHPLDKNKPSIPADIQAGAKVFGPTRRIDGFMALLDAYVVLQDKKTDYENMI